MNYRHPYHAGNHTEVFKHAVLIELLNQLASKEKGYCVLDTHAGLGIYDLNSEEALKTGEANGGIRKVSQSDEPLIKRYLAVVHDVGGSKPDRYPGSPEIIRRHLRAQDRLLACELHPRDVVRLKENMRGDARVAVHHRDGYEAVGAFVPFPERRGLVFIDPPFESPEETQKLSKVIVEGNRKWPTGIFAIWYPIKDDRIGDALRKAVQQNKIPKAIQAEFLPHSYDGMSLAGSGIIITNAPWGIADRITDLMIALMPMMSTGKGRSRMAILTGDGGEPQ